MLCGAEFVALVHKESDKTVGDEPSRLGRALRKARTEQADYLDAIEDVRAAETVRLQVLADDLNPVLEDLPEGIDQIHCVVVPGDPPRLWIDMLAYVVIDEDGRSFRFLQNSGGRRTTLFETADRAEMCDAITGYIAHRVIDREREATLALARTLGRPEGGYTGAALLLAWICGFAVGVLALFIIGVIIAGAPGP
jgi:hypothetical protein